MATLKFKKVNKIYPNGVQAVFDFELDVKDKEFIVFVGPSGCGKSTTLRMLAGLEEITSGEIYIDDVVVNDVPPKDRDIAMVFQSYALYPHMSVKENMAFGLKLRKVPKAEIDKKVEMAAKALGLSKYLDRKPRALSGGQRQRVALGRAIVRDAKVFLMDEPLSNLDAKLRVQTRSELIKLHQRLETTTVYVTHDQVEAMTMASRIVVMKDGYIMQVGTPKEIYDNPNCVFVGGFIGTPPMNFIRGVVSKNGYFETGDEKDLNKFYKIKIPAGKLELIKANDMFDREIILGIRPEDIHDDEIVQKTYPDSTVKVKVDVAELLGAQTHIYAQLGESTFSASVDARYDIKMGQEVVLTFDMNKCHFFDCESEKVLTLDGNIKELNKVKKQIELEKEAKLALERQEEERLKETDPIAYQKLMIQKERDAKKAEKEAKRKEKEPKEKKGLIRSLIDFFKEVYKYNKEKKEARIRSHRDDVFGVLDQVDFNNNEHKNYIIEVTNKKIFKTNDIEKLENLPEEALLKKLEKFLLNTKLHHLEFDKEFCKNYFVEKIKKAPGTRNFNDYPAEILTISKFEMGEYLLTDIQNTDETNE